ncbi:MAG: hypothetical protein KGI75_20710 [Rhizobiaceae bacterium]|nr:hypothetical protein [Rhizobiaceae bacterium]
MGMYQMKLGDCGGLPEGPPDINAMRPMIKGAQVKDSSQKLIHAINKQNDAPQRNFLALILRDRQSSVVG